MTTTTPARKGEFTGFHMLLAAIGFFGVIIAVNITMAVFATASWTGLVVENTYVASQQFDTKRLAHKRQAEAGWTSSLSYEGATAILAVTDGSGAPVELGTPVLQINRPVGGHDDQKVPLTREADGSYTGPVTLGPGVWEARVEVEETELGPFQIHERFRIGGTAQ